MWFGFCEEIREMFPSQHPPPAAAANLVGPTQEMKYSLTFLLCLWNRNLRNRCEGTKRLRLWSLLDSEGKTAFNAAKPESWCPGCSDVSVRHRIWTERRCKQACDLHEYTNWNKCKSALLWQAKKEWIFLFFVKLQACFYLNESAQGMKININ